MTLAKYLWSFGSIIMIFLGSFHLILTFFTNKFSPKNAAVEESMKLTSPLLTDKLTIWSGWQGFNASHSAGIIFIGLINMYLVIYYFKIFESDNVFFLLNIFTVVFYIFLAYKYWFNIPMFGLLAALVCFVISYVLLLITR